MSTATTTNKQLVARWEAAVQPLVGLRIVAARYMTTEEMEATGFFHAPVVLQLGDGTLLYPGRDDEGNDAGALFIQPGKTVPKTLDCAPVI